MNHVVAYSGGLSSWRVAQIVINQHGTQNTTLLFCDTLVEDVDLYRFLDDTEQCFGLEITRIADGRTPWEVFKDKRFIGNTRAGICSKALKRDMSRRWIESNCDPQDTIIYFGFGIFEEPRFERARKNWEPWRVEAPLIERFETKHIIRQMLDDAGLDVPRLYDLGFEHNNCGGCCVKAGQGHWIHLLKTLPDAYADWEAEEQKFREEMGKDVAILRDRRGGDTRPLTLEELRQRIENEQTNQLSFDDWGGCGCF